MLQLLLILTLACSGNFAQATTIIINGEDDWAPYSSASADYKDVVGLAPEIVKAAFKSQGITAITRPVPFARCIYEVEKGKSLGCFDTIINQDTKDKYIFHKTPMFEAEMVVYGRIRDGRQNVTLKDMENKVVGTTNGYTYPTDFLQNKKILHSQSPTEKSQLEKLASNRIDYAVVWGLTGEYLLKNHPELAKKIQPVGRLSKDGLYLNFSKSHKDGAHYAHVFEKGLQAIRADGTYDRIMNRFRNLHTLNP